MPEATSGTLLTCDGPAIKQFVLKLDEERRGSMADSFVLRDLDDSHLLIRDDPASLTFIHKRLDELQAHAFPPAIVHRLHAPLGETAPRGMVSSSRRAAVPPPADRRFPCGPSQDSNSYTRVDVDVQSAAPDKGGPARKKSRK